MASLLRVEFKAGQFATKCPRAGPITVVTASSTVASPGNCEGVAHWSVPNRKQVAALSLADRIETNRQRFSASDRQIVQKAWFAGLLLQLDFCQWQLVLAGEDKALVESDLDYGQTDVESPQATFDLRLEPSLERLPPVRRFNSEAISAPKAAISGSAVGTRTSTSPREKGPSLGAAAQFSPMT